MKARLTLLLLSAAIFAMLLASLEQHAPVH
jgi:hypothetical protein